MSRCPSRSLAALVVLALTLGACGREEAPPLPAPAAEPSPQAQPVDIEDEIFPHVSARMPAEGLDPDGRVAQWALAAQVGATLHALLEACGQHDEAALRQMHDEQRDAMIGVDVDAARFDAVWTWAYRQARQKITMQPSADLERGCARLQDMQQEADRMRAMMQPAVML